jgi:nitrous oxidase accessory protein
MTFGLSEMIRRGSLVALAALALICTRIDVAAAQSQESRAVTTADDLGKVISRAHDGDTIVVSGGVFRGSLLIEKPLTLIGENWPVIDGGGKGTVVQIDAANVSVSGFIIRSSGSSLDQENSGIAVEAAGALIANNRFEDTLFGVYLRQAHGSVVRENVITSKLLEVPRRGDPIRVWYSNDVLIEGNVVTRGRDTVLWYSERLMVRNNEVSEGRYGLHFMYCDDAIIQQNRLINNSVGAFLMYSRRVHMQHNTIAHNRGPSGFGVGLKDMDDVVIEENLFLDNRIGAHLDTSPREVDSIGRFTGNVFAYNSIGVAMSPSVRNNEFSENSFVENEEHYALEGQGHPGANEWTVSGRGNYWSDYAGFDADNDGIGDIHYRSERLFEDLMRQEPNLRLFLYSPATNALDFAAKAFPMVRPQPKLEDSRPMMAPQIPAGTPSLPQNSNGSWYVYAVALLSISIWLGWLTSRPGRRYHYPVLQEETIV